MDFDQTKDINMSGITVVDGHGDPYTIDFGNLDCNNITSGITTSTWLDSNIATPTITLSDTIWANEWNKPSGKLTLNGDDADIEINGESVVGMLKEIRDRLNILQVSEEMEKEWDELRDLRERYEAKLAECQEKSRAWAALKQAG